MKDFNNDDYHYLGLTVKILVGIMVGIGIAGMVFATLILLSGCEPLAADKPTSTADPSVCLVEGKWGPCD